MSADRSLDEFFESQVLDEFPPLVTAFAYGSAVFTQRGYSEAQKAAAMADLVFIVDDPASWHEANLRHNSSHYSGIARTLLGSHGVALVQDRIGAKIYYNQCTLRGRRIKYGVMSEQALADDLEHWSSLYVSGRMHKPIRPLVPWPSDGTLEGLLNSNRRAAVETSLLLLPQAFGASELWGTLCRLSYAGDVRMGVGESGHKPDDIAAGQEAMLTEIYATPLAQALGADESSHSHLLLDAASPAAIVQDVSLPARQRRLRALPLHAQRTLLDELGPRQAHTSAASPVAIADHLDAAASALWTRSRNDADANLKLSRALQTSLARIVRRSSLAQTLKGVATAGVATSITYAIEKMRKRSRRGG